MEANKQMLIADLLEIDRGIAAILMGSGMHCVGCMAAHGESLEDACEVHGLDADEMIEKINNYLKSKE